MITLELLELKAPSVGQLTEICLLCLNMFKPFLSFLTIFSNGTTLLGQTVELKKGT